jgi:hypothetical protein
MREALFKLYAAVPALALLTLLIVGGCGGGTSGTGVDDSGFQGIATEGYRVVAGSLVRSDGTPIIGAMVRSVASGREVTTDDEGEFALEVPEMGEPFVIEVLFDDQIAIVEFQPSGDSEEAIILQIAVDAVSGVASVEIRHPGQESLFAEVPVETSVREVLL